MKQKLFIFLALIGVAVLMIALNAMSYVQRTKMPDNEMNPNRSTYNPGATGTMALYTLLAESGRTVSRWQMPPESLLTEKDLAPATLVIVGPVKRSFDEEEAGKLLEWVAAGGRLVVIDRDPYGPLAATSAAFELSIRPALDVDLFSIDPANQTQMTADTPAVKPAQPTLITASVNAVQPSRFASSVKFDRFDNVDLDEVAGFGDEEEEEGYTASADDNSDGSASPQSDTTPDRPADPHLQGMETDDEPYDFYKGGEQPTEPPPPPASSSDEVPHNSDKRDTVVAVASPTPALEPAWFKGPVVHLAAGDRNILVDVPYGSGQIVFLTDPFIVSNGGITMADNLRLAVNVVTAGGGSVAFDEYRQGYGSGTNRIIEYFEGTPVTAIFLQVFAIAALIVFSRARRFARPVPEAEPDRLSKLEYVGAMAELQHRTKAYDLAMENIYTDFRRRVARHFGIDNMTTSRKELTRRIAERTGDDPSDLERMLKKCEDIIHGDTARKSEVVSLAGRLREIESGLNISRKARSRI